MVPPHIKNTIFIRCNIESSIMDLQVHRYLPHLDSTTLKFPHNLINFRDSMIYALLESTSCMYIKEYAFVKFTEIMKFVKYLYAN